MILHESNSLANSSRIIIKTLSKFFNLNIKIITELNYIVLLRVLKRYFYETRYFFAYDKNLTKKTKLANRKKEANKDFSIKWIEGIIFKMIFTNIRITILSVKRIK